MVSNSSSAARARRRGVGFGIVGAGRSAATTWILLRFRSGRLPRGKSADAAGGVSGGVFAFPKLVVKSVQAYNESMARGWESKSVEAQIDMAESASAAAPAKQLTPEAVAHLRRKESRSEEHTSELQSRLHPVCRL